MQSASKILVALLVLVVALLAANLVAVTFRSGSVPATAQADIVSGKNYFTTHSPDGKVVYLWFYEYQESLSEKNATVFFLGQIEAGGKFQK